MLIFSTALLLAWHSLNNQVYSPPHLSVSGNGIGPNISPWGTSLLQIKWYARMERDEREKMIHMENVNWRARWKVIQADKPGQWLSLSLCEALESFQREEAFRYPGVRLSGLFQHSLMALFHCMVRHGTVRYGSLLGGFPLGTVLGTWYFFSTTSVEVPCKPYRYQNVTCKLCWSPIGLRKSSLLRHWTCDTRPSSIVLPARFKSAQPAKDRTQLLFKQTHIFASTTK